VCISDFILILSCIVTYVFNSCTRAAGLPIPSLENAQLSTCDLLCSHFLSPELFESFVSASASPMPSIGEAEIIHQPSMACHSAAHALFKHQPPAAGVSAITNIHRRQTHTHSTPFLRSASLPIPGNQFNSYGLSRNSPPSGLGTLPPIGIRLLHPCSHHPAQMAPVR
jgi:hypothetical protein